MLKKSFIYNILIFIIVLLGTIFMITGYQFMTNSTTLIASGLSAFKYFTVDSNIIAGIASLIMIIYEHQVISKKRKIIPKYVYVFKYISTVAVMLTFIVTLFYLAPIFGSKFYTLYLNTNLLFHLIVPILCLISFIRYEKGYINFKDTFLGLIPMGIYAIYYVINILVHLNNGQIDKVYDWYSFVIGGPLTIIIAVLIITCITYLISYLIWKFNKKEV